MLFARAIASLFLIGVEWRTTLRRCILPPALALEEHFADLADPRREHARRHALLDVLAIALCAALSGAEGFVDMARFGQAREGWLRERLGLALPGGIPSHDTFGRVFARLDPDAFSQCFLAWTQALHAATRGRAVALDGKTLRRSFGCILRRRLRTRPDPDAVRGCRPVPAPGRSRPAPLPLIPHRPLISRALRRHFYLAHFLHYVTQAGHSHADPGLGIG